MKKIIIITILGILSINIYADKIDSLKNLINSTIAKETDKVLAYNDLAWASYDIDTSLYYAFKGIELSKEIEYKEASIQLYRIVSINYRDLGNYDSVFHYLDLAKDVGFEIEDFSGLGSVYNSIGLAYKSLGEYDKALENYEQSRNYFAKVNDTIGITQADINLGNVYRDLGNYTKALEYQFEALDLSEKINDKTNQSLALNNIGNIYYYQEEYEKAISYYKKSLIIKEELGNKRSICFAYNNIGSCMKNMEIIDSALYYQKKNYNLSKEINNSSNIISACREISEIYLYLNENDSALKYIEEGYILANKTNKIEKLISMSVKYAMYYEAISEFDLAFKYADEALQIATEIGNVEEMKNAAHVKYMSAKKLGMIDDALESYEIYIEMRDSIQNESNYKKAISQEFTYKEEKIRLEQEKAEIEHKAEIKQQKILTRSFIVGFILMILIAFMVLRSFLQKKKANKLLTQKNIEISQQKEEIFAQKEEIQTQAEVLAAANLELEKLSIVASETDNAVVIMSPDTTFEWINEGFTKLYGYTFEEFTEKHNNMLSASSNPKIKEVIQQAIDEKKTIIYESKMTSKSNEEMWVQTTVTPILDDDGSLKKIIAIDSDIRKLKEAEQKISAQNEELTFKNQQITDSISYAQTIQNAILPLQENLDKHFENFVLFRPKDIVSGDFYWFIEFDNYLFIADIDCTGHGVPGAFMSMIGNTLLNQIVTGKKKTNTANIMTSLNKMIIKALKQEKTDNDDGMDVCMVRIDKEKTELQFTGAKRDLFYYKKSEDKILRLKSDRKSIGGTVKKRVEVEFTAQNISIEQEDVYYLFSDGYIDQNNAQRKKFGTVQLLKIFDEIATKPMYEQKEILETKLDKWMQNTKQRDDISMIGIRI